VKHGAVWASQFLGRRFQTLVDRAGIAGVTLHTLRHTCASRLVQAGVDLYVVQKWLGHSTIVTTERYAHLSVENLEGAVSALEPAAAGALAQPASRAGTVH
jgi:site-specific recombinase XerD